MRHDQETTLLHRVLDHMAAGTTDRGEMTRSPVTRYLSPQRNERERRMIRTLPVVVGAASSVAKPGEWLTHDLSGLPILVVRDQDGVLRAFVNACRHRGARLAEPPVGGATRRTFSCRYHAWTYGLDGRLRGMPFPEEFEGLDRDAHSLVPLPVAEGIGLVWVVPTPGAPAFDLRSWLGPFGEDLRSYGYDGFVQYATRRFDAKADWKLLADANLEAYHVQYLHRDSIAPMFLDNRMLGDIAGEHLRAGFPKKSIETLRDVPESQWRLGAHVNFVYWFFPNTMLLLIDDHASLFTIWPRGVGDSAVEAITLVPELPTTDKARRHWDRNVGIFFDALMEDFGQMESMQSTFASGANTHLTFGRSEWWCEAFEEKVERHLARLGDER
jgi:phenylpropionate dioxygenase-like ring-hydroxylating dioxygenase large terminal subunit